jgi:hypothetical protein
VNAQEYDKLSAELAAEADGIQTSKRPGYTGGNVDVLANFKNVADRIDTICPHCSQPHKLTAHNVWSVYFFKHIDAIISIMNRPDLPVSEAAIGRFSDARNYGALGYALQQERDNAHVIEKRRRDVELLEQLDKQVADHIDQWRAVRAAQPDQQADRDRTGSGDDYWQTPRNGMPYTVGGPIKSAIKVATVLQPVLSGGRQATPPPATLNDLAQIAALGAHMQRARDSEVAAGRQVTSPAPTESYRLLGLAGPVVQGTAGFEASAGCSTPYSGPVTGNTVQLAELPQDTSPL